MIYVVNFLVNMAMLIHYKQWFSLHATTVLAVPPQNPSSKTLAWRVEIRLQLLANIIPRVAVPFFNVSVAFSTGRLVLTMRRGKGHVSNWPFVTLFCSADAE